MLIKAPRWLLALEGALLLGALGVLAYKAAMWTRPLEGLDQTPHSRKIDPETQVHQYYREYPESYIRITKESWRYDDRTRTAIHSLTLKNSATVSYRDIEVRFSYESSGGKVLLIQTNKIPGTLASLGTMDVSGVRVKEVPAEATRVVASVLGALPSTGP
jgi:hypothetical protein